MIRRPPSSPLFPYPPLSRSERLVAVAPDGEPRRHRVAAVFLQMVPHATQRRVEIESGDTAARAPPQVPAHVPDRKSTRLNSSHGYISYAVFCLKKKKKKVSP